MIIKQAIISILLFSLCKIEVFSQTELVLNNECPEIRYSGGTRNYPGPNQENTYKKLNIDVNWVRAIDSIDFQKYRFNPIKVKQGLAFWSYLGPYAIDVKTGVNFSFGDSRFQDSFTSKDFVLSSVYDSIDFIDKVSLISLASGDTLHKVRNIEGSSHIEFFSESVFFGRDRKKVYAYSLSQKKVIWSMSKADRYEYFLDILGYGRDALLYRTYNNYKSDSISRAIYYVSTEGQQIIKKIDLNSAAGGFLIRNNNFYFSYNDRFLSVNIPRWEVNWCIAGDWRGSLIERDNILVTPDVEIGLNNGQITYEKDHKWTGPMSLWSDYYVAGAYDGDENELFLVTHDRTNYFQPNFKLNKTEIRCDLNEIIRKNEFLVANSKDRNTIAYFNCDGKTYLIGLRIEPGEGE